MTIRHGLIALALLTGPLLTLSGQAQAYSYAAAGKEPLIDAREALLGAATDGKDASATLSEIADELTYLEEHHKVELHNQKHTEATVFRFPGANQYRLQVEAFSRAAQGSDDAIFTLEDSIRNQKLIDATFRAGNAAGWVDV